MVLVKTAKYTNTNNYHFELLVKCLIAVLFSLLFKWVLTQKRDCVFTFKVKSNSKAVTFKFGKILTWTQHQNFMMLNRVLVYSGQKLVLPVNTPVSDLYGFKLQCFTHLV